MTDSIRFKNTKVGWSGKDKKELLRDIKSKKSFNWDYRRSPEGQRDYTKLLYDHNMSREQIDRALDNGYSLKMLLKRKGEKVDEKYVQFI